MADYPKEDDSCRYYRELERQNLIPQARDFLRACPVPQYWKGGPWAWAYNEMSGVVEEPQRPILFRSYLGDDGDVAHVLAVSASHVVCDRQRVFTRIQFHWHYMSINDESIGVYNGLITVDGVFSSCPMCGD